MKPFQRFGFGSSFYGGRWVRFAVCLGLAWAVVEAARQFGAEVRPGGAADPQVGRSFRIPYRLTETNHFLVRVRINGKGPFNFLVDSGAPALYIATATAAQVGLKTPEGEFWTPVDRLDLEGGARLLGVKAKVEDPFQLVGMNALGLPGASIDGILGFTILARFRLEIDPTRDRMIWTRLNNDPPDPPVPPKADRGGPPLELQAMNALGPIAKGLALLMGRQPEERREPRGFLGVEWSESESQGSHELPGSAAPPRAVRIDRVLEGSPAAQAGLRPGDRLIQIRGQTVGGLASARSLWAETRVGDPLELVIEREEPGQEPRRLTLSIIAGEGL